MQEDVHRLYANATPFLFKGHKHPWNWYLWESQSQCPVDTPSQCTPLHYLVLHCNVVISEHREVWKQTAKCLEVSQRVRIQQVPNAVGCLLK